MPFTYETNTAAIVNILQNAATTTATVNISEGLTSAITTTSIFNDDPEVKIRPGFSYPAIFVRTISKTEEFGGLGLTGSTRARKFATVIYEITGFYRRDGISATHAPLLIETQKFAENIEGALREEPTLSGTALWSQPISTEIGAAVGENNVWIKGIQIQLEAKYSFR